MKPTLRIFIMLLLATLSLSAKGQARFSEISALPEFNYSYISPAMLAAMGENFYEAEGMRLPFKNLKSLETVSTMTNGTNEEFWKTIRQVIKDDDLETYSTTKNLNNRSDLLAHSDGKNITSLMVITQYGGNWVSVTYIRGDIDIRSIAPAF